MPPLDLQPIIDDIVKLLEVSESFVIGVGLVCWVIVLVIAVVYGRGANHEQS